MKAQKSIGLDSPLEWRLLQPQPIIGVDEVGRGCLAGRVYAAAVILNDEKNIERYTDSKLISENQRNEIAEEIISHHQVGIGFASVEEIDSFNILKASLLAMKRAVLNLSVETGHIAVDGVFNIPEIPQFAQTTIIKGDLRCSPIAAASIVAKVTRDRYMQALSIEYPQYAFEKHKGYSTKVHKQKIMEFGASPEHRKTFRGVREFL